MKEEKSKFRADLEWEQRRLCSDEACIGVIGADGRCKECGLPYDGEPLPEDFEGASDGPAEDTAVDTAEGRAVEETQTDPDDTEEDASISDLEWEQRRLCSDEACIGVIGADGRCKECGLPYDSNV